MTDYSELVKALRRCAEPGTIIDECDTSDDCPYSFDGYCGDCINNLVKDAAAAIEELEAKNKELHGRIEDKELQIDMLTADNTNYDIAIDELKALLPKLGEWIEVNKIKVYCSNCHWASYSMLIQNDGFLLRNNKTKFCPNCGAKMGVQE